MTDGFDQNYWKANYSEPHTMDGIANAQLHARYLHSLFALEGMAINSLIDFGFGLGFMLEKMVKTFAPAKVVGLEPSSFAFDQVVKRPFFSSHPEIRLSRMSMGEWCQAKKDVKVPPFELGLCTSVFQYIPTAELEKIVPVLGKRVKFLYLTVPTDEELARQRKDFDFADAYALHRPQSFYRQLLVPHFTFISSRLLESKVHYSWPDTTLFAEHLYRF